MRIRHLTPIAMHNKTNQAAAAAGFYLSVPPCARRSPLMQKWVKRVPLERLLLETDAPALVHFPMTRIGADLWFRAVRVQETTHFGSHPPIPKQQAAEKGEVNYPQNLPTACEVIAEIKGVSVQEVARETRRNALRLFFQRELDEEGGVS